MQATHTLFRSSAI